MLQRIAFLQKKLPLRAAGLIASPVGRRYCTGFASSAGQLLLCRDAALFFTDSRYVEAAKAEIHGIPVEEWQSGKQLSDFCRQHKIKRLFLEDDRTTLQEFARLRRQLPGVYIERGALLSNALAQLRRVKAASEIADIRTAQGIAEAALQQVLARPLEGMTERALALALDFAMLSRGADALAFETIVAVGENGAKPHAVPGERTLRPGNLITMDFGCVVHGLHSDMTRTVALGSCSQEQRRSYEIVLRAQAAALSLAAPGVSCKQVDAAARNVIHAAGFGEHFRHSTGHGVGYEIHESPALGPNSRDILAPGMVVTVEPGIYLPGRHGVRIEDMVLITETGCENLTRAPKSLAIYN